MAGEAIMVDNRYLQVICLIILGRMREVDEALKRDNSLKNLVYSTADKLVKASGLNKKSKHDTLYRGIVVVKNKGEDTATLTHLDQCEFASFSLNPEVACWFADPASFMNSQMQDQVAMTALMGGGSKELSGFVVEYTPSTTQYIWHPSFDKHIAATVSERGILSFAKKSMRDDFYSQLAWNFVTQQEVIIKPFKAKLKAHPISEYGCPSTKELDEKFTHKDFRFNLMSNPGQRFTSDIIQTAKGGLFPAWFLAKVKQLQDSGNIDQLASAPYIGELSKKENWPINVGSFYGLIRELVRENVLEEVPKKGPKGRLVTTYRLSNEGEAFFAEYSDEIYRLVRETRMNKNTAPLKGNPVSDIVYHGTNLKSATNILNENKFKLSLKSGNTESFLGRHETALFYLSTARSPTSTYLNFHNGEPHRTVILVLDGRKLNQKYKGGPVDWHHAASDYEAGAELEDRIWSKSSEIPDAMSYIKEIHVYIRDAKQFNNFSRFAGMVKKTFIIAKKNRIPIYFYTTDKSYRTLAKSQALTSPPESILNAKTNMFPTNYEMPGVEMVKKQSKSDFILQDSLDFANSMAALCLMDINKFDRTVNVISRKIGEQDGKTVERLSFDNIAWAELYSIATDRWKKAHWQSDYRVLDARLGDVKSYSAVSSTIARFMDKHDFKSTFQLYDYLTQKFMGAANAKLSRYVSEQAEKHKAPEIARWRMLTEEELKQEYEWEFKTQVSKGWLKQEYFPTFEKFKLKIINAPIVIWNEEKDRRCKNRSRTSSLKELKELVSTYKYPRDVDGLVEAFIGEYRSPLPYPIILNTPEGMTVLSGNTRLDIAFILGLKDIHVIVVNI